jgi:hypothetical protein
MPYGTRLVLLAAIVSPLLLQCQDDVQLKDPPEATEGSDVLPDLFVTVDCGPGLTFWQEYAICAPRIDECEHPWELPLIGGGCVAIGPRACPKLWDPEADVDCEPGELLEYDGAACPEGFVLTEDEVSCIPFFSEECGTDEIPVIGGGCVTVGPVWPAWLKEPGSAPADGECPAGQLPVAEGRCLVVGPRACAALWNPELDSDCDASAELPCPQNWEAAPGGLWCEPTFGDCEWGSRSLAGSSCERVIPTAEECPPGPYPDVPAEATSVYYVNAQSTCVEECGSSGAPFSSLQLAVQSAPAGGTVLVAPGVYEEGLLIADPVEVIGHCAATVEIIGLVQPPSEFLDGPTSIAIVDAGKVRLQGLKVSAEGTGILVAGSSEVEVDQIELVGSSCSGLLSTAGGKVNATNIWVHDMIQQEHQYLFCGGIAASLAGQLSVQSSLLELTSGAGAAATGAGTDLHLVNVEIRQTVPAKGASDGPGLFAVDGATLTVEECLVRGNVGIGVLLRDSGTKAEFLRTVVADTLLGAPESWCSGVAVWSGASASMEESVLSGNHESGLWVDGAGSAATLERVAVVGTLPNPAAGWGDGIWATSGATFTAAGCIFHGNSSSALFLEGASAEVVASSLSATLPSGGWSGVGAMVFGEANLKLSTSLLSSNIDAGLLVGEEGSLADVDNSAILSTSPGASGKGGWGVRVGDRGSVKLRNSLVGGNQYSGVEVLHEGSVAELEGAIVRGTTPAPGDSRGWGLSALEMGTIKSVNCLIEENVQEGVAVRDEGSSAVLQGTTVRRTALDEYGLWGDGAWVTGGGTIKLTSCLLEENSDTGVWTEDAGTIATLENSVVRHTLPDGNGDWGWGVWAAGGDFSMSGSLVESCNIIGVAVANMGTVAQISSSTIRDNLGGASGGGWGIEVVYGAELRFQGSAIVANRESGIVVLGGKTAVQLDGIVLSNTTASIDDVPGFGLLVFDGALGKMTWSNIANNQGVGAAVQGWSTMTYEDSSLSVSNCAIAGTSGMDDVEWWGKGQMFGDGLVATDGAQLDVSSTVIASNMRAGIYFRESAGSVNGSVVWGNGLHGLAMYQCSDEVTWTSPEDPDAAGAASHFFGNALEPPFSGEQIANVTQDFGTPDAPEPFSLPDPKD